MDPTQRGTLAFVFRSIPYEVKPVRDLRLPGVLETIAMKPRGLVLVTGVTGSGKSTALAAMVNHINLNRRCNIITIEDPIEFLHRDGQSNISQREVGTDTLSFETALRHVLRQDPDVILIGEIRDKVTLDTAMKAASATVPRWPTITALVTCIAICARFAAASGAATEAVAPISAAMGERAMAMMPGDYRDSGNGPPLAR